MARRASPNERDPSIAAPILSPEPSRGETKGERCSTPVEGVAVMV
jgi:hypothetical protein